MNKTLLGTTIGFALGSGIGIGVGFLLAKNKYEAKADKEIQAVKNLYNDFYEKNKVIPEDSKKISDDSALKKETKPKTEKEEYIEYSKQYRSSNAGDEKKVIDRSTLDIDNNDRYKHIILISPEEYRSSEYESKTLWYYADKVLADEDNNVIHVPEEVVGDEALSSFGRYEDDCVYVRDEKKKVDYEILYSQLTFEEHMQREREHK